MASKVLEKIRDRELFAAMILQGIVASGSRSKEGMGGDIAIAVKTADDLIKVLRKGGKGEPEPDDFPPSF